VYYGIAICILYAVGAFLFSFLKVKNQLTVMMTLIDGMIELRIYKKAPNFTFLGVKLGVKLVNT
jgi:hypothetical protein